MNTKEGMIEYCRKVCETNGWILIKDEVMYNDLIEGLVENKNNYGYQSCPCRLASGDRDLDRDIICPCDYASQDISNYKACYCNLYLDPTFYDTDIIYVVVPERRPEDKDKGILDYLKEIQ